MPRTPLSLDDYIDQINARLRLHPKYREGMRVTRDMLANTGGPGSYTFEWPKHEGDKTQAWFDARDAVFDVEMELRELYDLATEEAPAHA
jgi:hypothetical protein